MAADDAQAGEALAEAMGEQLERGGGAPAVEVDGGAVAGGARAEGGHQVGPIDAGGAGVAEQAQGPHERHPVGHGERGAECGGERGGFLAGAHHEVDGGGGEVPARAGGDHVVHPVEDLPVVGDRERDAEDLCAGRWGGAVRMVAAGVEEIQ